MTMFKNAFATLAFVGLGAAHGATPARAGGNDMPVKVLSELKGAKFDVGTKTAVTYYQSELGACKVTVMVSEPYVEQLPVHLATVRFNTSVAAGTTARVGTSDGASLMLTCAQGAKSMMVETIDRVAADAYEWRKTN